MLPSYGRRRPCHHDFRSVSRFLEWTRSVHSHHDDRNRLSRFWTPTAGKLSKSAKEEDSNDLLVRAGFLRQAHSGIFHLLPLGVRVQDKIEHLIDKHMLHLGASKVSLSSISSQDLWQRSGRFQVRDSEFFKLHDRKGAKYLLAPTHEEEITTIVSQAVHSYKDLPLRLYQISRKYRDEARPRQGLLRGREFVMKDLYTFDSNEQQARATYDDVRKAYGAFLTELGLRYLSPQADSGDMGGSLSHEYHFVSSKGEDTIIGCDSCDNLINEELYAGQYNFTHGPATAKSSEHEMAYQTWDGYSKDGTTVVTMCIPRGEFQINIHAAKRLFPDLDTSFHADNDTSIRRPTTRLAFRDPRIPLDVVSQLVESRNPPTPVEKAPFLLTKAREGDPCPRCDSGKLTLSRAIEIGHTFHLGQRYSVPLEANVLDVNNKQIAIQMGCHGIGVSRLIGAVASLLADNKGLNWPTVIAPFNIVIVAVGDVPSEDVESMYDSLDQTTALDVMIDDRERSIGWKLSDADLIGYPFIVIMGKAWTSNRLVELQCRRLGVKEQIQAHQLGQTILEYTQTL